MKFEFSAKISLGVLAMFASAGMGYAQKQAKIYQPVTVNYQEDAGAVHVAIIGARHLDEVIGELQPQFEMNEKIALDRSIPVTLSYYNEAISSFKAALKIALPGTSTTSTETQAINNGVTNRQSSDVENSTPGDVSKLSPESASHPALRDGKVPDGALGTEALTQYQVAKTLFQEIKILNRSLKDLPRSEKYEPYVVTMQISLMPYQRGLRYDAYSTLSFFPNEAQGSIPPALRNEISNIVSEVKARAITNATQLSNRLSAACSQPVVTPAWSGSYKPLIYWNSFFVAEATPAAPKAKMGTTNFTDSERDDVLIYLGSLLGLANESATDDSGRVGTTLQPVIVPLLATDNLEAADNDRILNQIRQLNLSLAGMFSGVGAQLGLDWFKQNLEAVNARDLNGLLTLGRLNDSTLRVRLGAMLQSKSEFAMVPRTHNISVVVMVPKGSGQLAVLGRTVFRDSITGEELARRSERAVFNRFKDSIHRYDDDADICKKSLQPILDTIAKNDFVSFCESTRKLSPKLTNFSQVLWVELSELYVGSQYGSAHVDLPKAPALTAPTSTQTLFATDDGSGTAVTIKGGKFPSVTGVSAELKYPGPVAASLYADSITALTGGSGLQVKFPSLHANSLRSKTNKAERVAGLAVVLTLPMANSKLITNLTFGDIFVIPKGQDPVTSPYQVVATEGYLVAGDTASRKYGITLQKTPNETNEYYLRVEGPFIKSVTSGTPAATITREPDGTIKLQGDGELVFEFDYLLPNTEVAFVVMKKGEKGKATVEVIKKERVVSVPATASKTAPGTSG